MTASVRRSINLTLGGVSNPTEEPLVPQGTLLVFDPTQTRSTLDFSAILHGNAAELKAFTSLVFACTLPAQWPTQPHGSAIAIKECKKSKESDSRGPHEA